MKINEIFNCIFFKNKKKFKLLLHIRQKKA